MPENDKKYPWSWQGGYNDLSSITSKLTPSNILYPQREIDPETGLYSWVEDITDEVNNGVLHYHPKQRRNGNGENQGMYFRDPETGNIYFDWDYGNDNYIPLNLDNVEVLSHDAVAKMFPARDYIGGSTDVARRKALEKMPEVKQYIKDLAATYGIDPNVLAHRFIREGYIDQHIREYNNYIDTVDQKDFWQNAPNESVWGYAGLGLDDFVSNYNQGFYNLRRNFEFYPSDYTNEKNRTVHSADFNNLWDALEAKAADMEYRKKLALSRGIPENQLNAYINAMYNLGAYHNDLKNTEYVLRNYSVPSYYKSGGKIVNYLKKFNYSGIIK